MLQSVEKNHSHVEASFALCGNRDLTRQWIAWVISTPNDILERTMAEFSRASFQSFLWWRVFEDCSMIFVLMIYDAQLHWIDRKWGALPKCRGAYSIEIFHCMQDIVKLKTLKGNCYTRSLIIIWVGFQWKTTPTTFIKAKRVWHFKPMFLILNTQYVLKQRNVYFSGYYVL